jgi:molybdopterin molybdotransferase
MGAGGEEKSAVGTTKNLPRICADGRGSRTKVKTGRLAGISRWAKTKGDNGERMSAAPQSAGVVSFEQARETVLKYREQIAAPLTEVLALPAALGRALAGPVQADRDFPPFPRATRDGFAVRADDVMTVPASLRVVGQAKAGGSYDQVVTTGEAVEIMTGAAVPEGADAVVMVEYTSTKNAAGKTEVEIQRPVAAGENIVPAGAEAQAGQEILPGGMRLGPAQIALAAGAGQARINVYRRPRVAILSTGDELVEVAKTPGPFQIRNSNSYSLAAQVTAAGGEAMRLPVAPDLPRKLASLIRAGLAADMLVISGGVSMGKFDLVETELKKMGARFFFTGALIQPGRPVVFGDIGIQSNRSAQSRAKARDLVRTKNVAKKIPFFGLPGNPISAMVCFDLFVRPVLDALSGALPARLPAAKARLGKAVKTKTGLTRFFPAILQGSLLEPEVEVVPWQGSGDLLASAQANCYLVVPPDRDSLAAGEMVSIVIR